VILSVLPTNDAPIVICPATVVTSEDEEIFISGVRVDDADLAAGAEQTLEVELTANHGTLSFYVPERYQFHYIEGDGSNDAHMHFVGSIENINLAFTTMTYTGEKDWFGGDEILIVARDKTKVLVARP